MDNQDSARQQHTGEIGQFKEKYFANNTGRFNHFVSALKRRKLVAMSPVIEKEPIQIRHTEPQQRLSDTDGIDISKEPTLRQRDMGDISQISTLLLSPSPAPHQQPSDQTPPRLPIAQIVQPKETTYRVAGSLRVAMNEAVRQHTLYCSHLPDVIFVSGLNKTMMDILGYHNHFKTDEQDYIDLKQSSMMSDHLIKCVTYDDEPNDTWLR